MAKYPYVLRFAHEAETYFYLVAALAISILIAFSYAKVVELDARRRARWIVVGSLVGLLPYAALWLVFLVSQATGGWLAGDTLRITMRVCFLLTAAIPATTTYAVLMHKTFDIDVAIGRGLQYLLLRGVLESASVLPVTALVISLVGNSQATVADALWHNPGSVAMLTFLAVVLVFRGRLRRWLDQRFPRELGGRFQYCKTCKRCFDWGTKRCDVDGTMLRKALLPVSREIHGQYQLSLLCGEGGMGSVYKAKDLSLPRDVAIKIIGRPEVNEENRDELERVKERARREYTALRSLWHQNIVATLNFIAAEKSPVVYLVMEFVEGETLRATLASGRVMPEVAAGWFDQLLDGLEAAHAAGVVHRDLKPENVLLTNDGTIKIADFGIAKLKPGNDNGKQSDQLTATNALMGTVRYMSPEQMDGETADERSDIFAVSLMILEVLVGRPARAGSTYGQVASSAGSEVDLLLGKGAAPELGEVLRKGLAQKPSDRYGSARELRSAVIPLMRLYKAEQRS